MKLYELKSLFPYHIAKKQSGATNTKYRMFYIGTTNPVIYENELINGYKYIEGGTVKECYEQLDNYSRGVYYNGRLYKERYI